MLPETSLLPDWPRSNPGCLHVALAYGQLMHSAGGLGLGSRASFLGKKNTHTKKKKKKEEKKPCCFPFSLHRKTLARPISSFRIKCDSTVLKLSPSTVTPLTSLMCFHLGVFVCLKTTLNSYSCFSFWWRASRMKQKGEHRPQEKEEERRKYDESSES